MKAAPLNLPGRTIAVSDNFGPGDSVLICSDTLTAYLPKFPIPGEVRVMKNIHGATVTVDGNGLNIDGASTKTSATQYETIWFRFNGSTWDTL